MAFSRSVKRPIECLLKQHSYSSWAYGYHGHQLPEVRDKSYRSLFCHGDFQGSYGVPILVRRFSVEVSASEQMNLIKQLRERTSAPIKAVKSALVDCKWDIEAAQKDLRKRGIVLASKNALRTATEGLLALVQDEKKAVVIELNCETDFVARNEIFRYLDMKISLDHPKFNGVTTVKSAITEVSAMVGENVKLRRGWALSRSSHGVVSSYLHTSPQPGLGRIAGVLTLEAEDPNVALDALQRVGSPLAMHIVASKPLFLSKDLVPSEALENERDILKTQAANSGKPQAAIEKMVEGRLKKYFEDVVFLEQKFVMNDNINIKSVLNDLSKEVGSSVKIGNFFRMEVGGAQRSEPSTSPETAAQAA
ncbi:elongation factor Ts, mitochondrial isoform X2 [Amborella trichopoda]|uniref:elongation factor Ts, mitochondrial isoform X2 n=1 Tax=Amborella trichopoda TaxID=13333 RepID=UPI0009C0624B|nr:elongation factor Ts, mitochondrial isoform X2 [Amborella trichopoda]|eukprot:XP_020531252.1 elongation factor Ts, mitochondrial isoform X2 [Amborella trichopoda]